MSADVGTVVNTALASFTGIAFGVVALGTTIVHLIGSKSHSPKIAVLEKDLATAQQDIKDIQGQSANIAAAAQIATTVMPQIGKDIATHQQQITALETEIANLTAQLQALQNIIPATANKTT